MTAAPMNTCACALRPLTAALTLTLASMTCLDTAAAQTAPAGFQVIELDYAPATAAPGLDLRPGSYLLQLRGSGASGYVGLLRGPGNEIVGDHVEFSASGSCSAGIGSDAVIAIRALPARRDLNLLGVEVRSSSGDCSLHGTLPALGLAAPMKPPQELECAPPEEVSLFGETDGDPACAPPPPPPQLPIASKPELRPGSTLRIAGSAFNWSQVVRLDASHALLRDNGRCSFDYAFSVENVGWARSASTDASLVLEKRFGLQIDARSIPALAPGGRAGVSGTLALPPGLWRVFAHADSSGKVREYDAINNARSVLVEVVGDCSKG